ncbi:hypothetical protein T439DRAFT_383634 [Meredithblackwellia eburnea MCA 4105]
MRVEILFGALPFIVSTLAIPYDSLGFSPARAPALVKRVAAVEVRGNTRTAPVLVAPACQSICQDYLFIRWACASSAEEIGALRCSCVDSYATKLTACASCIISNPADGETGLDETPSEYNTMCANYFTSVTTGYATPSQTVLPTATATAVGPITQIAEQPQASAVYIGTDGSNVDVYVAEVCASECNAYNIQKKRCYSSPNTHFYGNCCFPEYINTLSGCASCVKQNPAKSILHYDYAGAVSLVNSFCRQNNITATASITSVGGYTTGAFASASSTSATLGATGTTASASSKGLGTGLGEMRENAKVLALGLGMAAIVVRGMGRAL